MDLDIDPGLALLYEFIVKSEPVFNVVLKYFDLRSAQSHFIP